MATTGVDLAVPNRAQAVRAELAGSLASSARHSLSSGLHNYYYRCVTDRCLVLQSDFLTLIVVINLLLK